MNNITIICSPMIEIILYSQVIQLILCVYFYIKVQRFVILMNTVSQIGKTNKNFFHKINLHNEIKF